LKYLFDDSSVSITNWDFDPDPNRIFNRITFIGMLDERASHQAQPPLSFAAIVKFKFGINVEAIAYVSETSYYFQ